MTLKTTKEQRKELSEPFRFKAGAVDLTPDYVRISQSELRDLCHDADRAEELGKALEETTARLVALREAMKPFYDIAIGTSGRIPTERLSGADWHNLWKAYELPPPRGTVTLNSPPVLFSDENGVIVHDDKAHPSSMAFDDDGKPQ